MSNQEECVDAFPMIQRCKEAQWRGFTQDEQAYMIQVSDHGQPGYIGLGHRQSNLWEVEQWDGDVRRSPQPGEILICVKEDLCPDY